MENIIQAKRYGWSDLSGLEFRIDTEAFLAETMEVDGELDEALLEFAEGRGRESWFDTGDAFGREYLGRVCAARDNTYNNENDLNADFVWEVWTEDDGDWLYDDDPIVLIYLHRGGDVRGNYGRPQVMRPTIDSYALPLDWTVGFRAIEGHRKIPAWTDPEGNRFASVGPRKREELDWAYLDSVSEHWGVGYSGWPIGQLRDDVERVFAFTLNEDEGTFVAKLKTGEVVKIAPEVNVW